MKFLALLASQSCGISHFSWVYFYLRVLQRCTGGKNRTSLKERFLFWVLSPLFCAVQRNFLSGPLKASNLQVVGLQYLLNCENLLPTPLPSSAWLSPQGDSLKCKASSLHLCLILYMPNCMQSLGLGLKTTSTSYIKATLNTLPRTWEALFFKETNTFCFQS